MCYLKILFKPQLHTIMRLKRCYVVLTQFDFISIYDDEFPFFNLHAEIISWDGPEIYKGLEAGAGGDWQNCVLIKIYIIERHIVMGQWSDYMSN